MKTIKKALISAVIAASSVMFGCGGPTQETEFIDEMKKRGATQEEAEAAFVPAFRKEHGHQVEVDGKKEWIPNYDSVKLKDRLEVTREMKEDLDIMLGFENPRETKMADVFGVRQVWERRRSAIDFNLARLEQANTFAEFKKAMNRPSFYSFYSYESAGSGSSADVSDADLTIPDGVLESKIKFEAPYVEGARSENKLTVVERVEMNDTFFVKEKNPEYPQKDPTKEFRWVEKALRLRINGYDIGSDGNKAPKYIEVFRLDKDGKAENVPAIKVFHSMGSDDLDVIVMDSDPQGKPGHGRYDRIERFSISSAKDLQRNHEDLLKALYRDLPSKQRERPQTAPKKVYIVRSSDADPTAGLWEQNAENPKIGWDVPAQMRYKLPPAGANYNLVVCYRKKEQKSPDESELLLLDASMEKEIKYVAKEFHKPKDRFTPVDNRVVEFYRVKPEFSKVLNVTLDGKRVTLDLADGRSETVLDSRVLEATPYAKAFDQGESRFEIWDKDAKADPRYELRREYNPKPQDLKLDKDNGDKR